MRRGIDTVAIIGLVLIALDALALFITAQVLSRRFGASCDWSDPPLVCLAVVVFPALETVVSAE